MKITVLGIGNIGGTLGKKWTAAGHEVLFGVRDVTAVKVQTLTTETNTTAAPIPEAIAQGEVIVFAIPGTAVPDIISANQAALNGKIIIDATNNIRDAVMHSLPLFADNLPQAHLFRVFNSLGWENFAEPTIGGQQGDHFYCGDSGEAQTAVHTLIADIGLRPIYIGGNEQAAILDNLTRLWFILAVGQGNGRHLAFKTLSTNL
jgi:predicted dinucleotide-binding enzyme